MTIQVIEGLKALGASPSSTFLIPMEFTRLLGQVGNYLEQGIGAHATSNGWPRADERRVVPPLEPTDPTHGAQYPTRAPAGQ